MSWMSTVETPRSTSGPIEPGWHYAQCTRAVVCESRSGSPMIAFRFTVVGEDPDAGKHFRDWCILQNFPWGLGKLLRVCKAIDESMPDGKEGLDLGDRCRVYHRRGGPDGKGGEIDSYPNASQYAVSKYLLGGLLAVRTTLEDNEYEGKVRKQCRVEVWRQMTAEERAEVGVVPLPDDAGLDWDGNFVEGADASGASADVPF